ncbi:uncharacterized protein PG986_002500 [Apiospora aurea]|uniref:Uncharacterized protein n=1 Tax=Apiospora aurea TaxID=335848 RepID=A0ABR1QP83_9PEZI
MQSQSNESHTLLGKLASYFRWHKCMGRNVTSLESSRQGLHPVKLEKVSIRLSNNLHTTEYDATIPAIFNSNCNENLISRDIVERIMGANTILRAGDSGVIRIEFNFVGQRQRFETSHRIADIPRPEKIMFGRFRSHKDISDPSPLELHILNMDALSEYCTCCTEAVCRISDLSGPESCSWPNHAKQEDGHIDPGNLTEGETVDEAFVTEPVTVVRKRTPQDKSTALNLPTKDGDTIPAQLQFEHEYDSPRLQQHTLTPTRQNEHPSSNASFQISNGGTSDSWGQQSFSTRQAALTNNTSVDSHGVVARTEGQTQQSQTHRDQASDSGEYSRAQEHLQEKGYVSQQNEVTLSAATQPNSRFEKENAPTAGIIEGAPRAGREECDQHNDKVNHADEDEKLLLPFPDDYWTYDNEAKKYFHVDREEDGQETKVWYPLEFL